MPYSDTDLNFVVTTVTMLTSSLALIIKYDNIGFQSGKFYSTCHAKAFILVNRVYMRTSVLETRVAFMKTTSKCCKEVNVYVTLIKHISSARKLQTIILLGYVYNCDTHLWI
jgi:hypothetical protein